MPQQRTKPEKTIIKLISILVIFILLIIFAIQNFKQTSTIKILFWQIGKTPVSIIIFVSILVGAVIASAMIFPHIVRLRRRAKSAEAEAARLSTTAPAEKNRGLPVDADKRRKRERLNGNL